MAVINVIVKYNGGFLPDILMLTQVYYYYPLNYVLHCLSFCFVWRPCMAINVSVQYNGGLFPDITVYG